MLKMSKYRSVQVSFWQDAFVLDLTPEEKYFYIYLMTNSKANQIGIYELPKRIIETETGYSRETVDKLLSRFSEYEKIIYNEPTKEIMLVNWSKHNWNNSPKVVKRVEEELKIVKFSPFIEKYRESIENTDFNKVSIQYPNSMDIREKRKEKREKEKEKEKDKEKSEMVEDEISISPFKFFEENGFGILTPHVGQKVNAWIDDLSEELVLHAMKITIENGKSNWSYVEAILKDWFNRKIKNVEEVQALEIQRKKQQLPFRRPSKEEKVPDWINDQKAVREGKKVVEEDLSPEAKAQKQALLKKLGIKEPLMKDDDS